MPKFKADGTGRWALYDNPGNNDAAFNNPRANFSLVHAHSDFDYLAFDGTTPDIQVTVTIPQTVSNRFRSITVGPHGRSGVPFVFAQVDTYGGWVPLVGSVPVYVSPHKINRYWSGHLVNWTLELSNTHIYLRESRTTPTFSALPIQRTARFWISHNIMD